MASEKIRIRLDIDPSLIDFNKIPSSKIWYHLNFKEQPTISSLLNDISTKFLWKQTSHLKASLQQYHLPKEETTKIIEEDEILIITYHKSIKRKISEGDEICSMKKVFTNNIDEAANTSLVNHSSSNFQNKAVNNTESPAQTLNDSFEDKTDVGLVRRRNRKRRKKNKTDVNEDAYTNTSFILTNSTVGSNIVPNIKPPKSKRRYKDILPASSHITFLSDEEKETVETSKNTDEDNNGVPCNESFNNNTNQLSDEDKQTEEMDVSKTESTPCQMPVVTREKKTTTPVIQDDIIIYKRQRNRKEIKSSMAQDLNSSTPCTSSIVKNGISIESLLAKGKEMKKPPDINDWIVYKILELGSSYTPEISDFRFGKVIDYDQVTQQLDVKLVLIKSDETYELGTLDNVCWTSMIEPRVVEGFDLANVK
ncbi:DgyrCDS11040 [Dimorphilus gyrociliatus]|uniref:DgyrCDS11040 n=1 Tax=Dimorphilus gyrociliatus TaxID=2664684 RepID=A0A7I8W3H5_9ANNE|nr:DgyrCDS11040 [Dimorphilus gyrociliatus]